MEWTARSVQTLFKKGNTREQLFNAWRSFHYDKSNETLDTYVTRIRQVVALLHYGEQQILDIFNNILPKRLYWVFFPIEGLRVAVEMVKRILTKEKIDRQLAGQLSTTTPFLKVSESHNTTNNKKAIGAYGTADRNQL